MNFRPGPSPLVTSELSALVQPSEGFESTLPQDRTKIERV